MYEFICMYSYLLQHCTSVCSASFIQLLCFARTHVLICILLECINKVVIFIHGYSDIYILCNCAQSILCEPKYRSSTNIISVQFATLYQSELLSSQSTAWTRYKCIHLVRDSHSLTINGYA